MTGLAIPLMACLVTVAAVSAILLSTPVGTRNIAVPLYVTGAGVVFGLGLFDLARAREVRFARALIAAGLLWSLSALAASRNSTAYSLGRVSQWVVDLTIVYLLLTYPSGRLRDKTNRALYAGASLLVALLYLPTALVVPHFPAPSPWSSCAADCPSNTFALGHPAPWLVQDLVVPSREALAVALFAAVAVAVTRRWRSLGLLRGMYAPIAFVAAFRLVALAVYFPLRGAAPGSRALEVLSWGYAFSLPAVALACIGARMYRRLVAANALDLIAREVSASATATNVSRAMAGALEDPSLRILHSFPGDGSEWVDETGSPVALPQERADQGVTEVVSGRWRVAIVHDPALADDPALVRTAGSYALAALENDHLSGELRTSLRELAESRARSLDAEARGRRKIERDLHDGAQQHLIAVRVKLGLAAERLEQQDPAGAGVIRALEKDIDATIDEVRSFARGIYPALLAETGLGEALRTAARAAALPTTVHAERLGRYPPEIETTVYFSCSEALQNAAKHARGATRVTISVCQDRELHFKVCDDGAGFDVQGTPFGTGLTNLRDRLAVVGGTTRIRSVPGQGTCVGGSIPLA